MAWRQQSHLLAMVAHAKASCCKARELHGPTHCMQLKTVQDAKRAWQDKMQQPTLKFSSSGGTAQTRAPSFFTLPFALLPSALRDCCNIGSCLSIAP